MTPVRREASPELEPVRREVICPEGWQRMQPSLVFAVVSRFPADWELLSTRTIRHEWLAPGSAMVFATGIEELLPRLARDRNEWSIEVTVNLSEVGRGETQTLVASQSESTTNFTLSLAGKRLVYRLNTTGPNGEASLKEIPLATLSTGTHHLIVSYRDGETTCIVDGRLVTTTDRIAGRLVGWQPAGVLLGGQDGDAIGLTGVVLYGRFILPDEAEKRFELAATRFQF